MLYSSIHADIKIPRFNNKINSIIICFCYIAGTLNFKICSRVPKR